MALEEEEDIDEDENKQVDAQPTDVSIKKMGKVSTKLRKRLYNRALKNIQYAQKRSEETVEKLQFTVNLVRTECWKQEKNPTGYFCSWSQTF